MNITKPLQIGGGVAALISASLVGVAITTRETIEQSLKQDLLPSDEMGRWIKLSEEIKHENDLPEELIEIGKDKKGEKLKSWCESKKQEVFANAFDYTNKELYELAKRLCIYTIEKEIGDKSLQIYRNDGWYEINWKIKAKALGEYEETGGEWSPKLTNELKQIKEEIIQNEKWQLLRDWCKSVETKGYKGAKDNLWLTVKKFCIEPTIKDFFFKDFLPKNGMNDEWKKKLQKIGNESGKHNLVFSNANKEEEKIKALQEWCDKQHFKDWRTDIKNKKPTLITKVKDLCIVPIKEKIQNNSLTEEEWKKNVKALIGFEDSQNLKLTPKLKKIKSKLNPEGEGWELLKERCESIYKKGYIGTWEQNWKLANKFCKKS